MSTLLIAALVLAAPNAGELASSPQAAAVQKATAKPSPAELRRGVRSALRNEAVAQSTDRYRAAVVLTERLRQLVDDTRMARGQRRRLITKVVFRLRGFDEAERRKILAQVGFGQQGQAGQGGGGKESAEALAELIKSVVAPDSWVDNGGRGAIVVFGR